MPARVPLWAHYRKATVAGTDCGTCDFYSDGRCEMFQNAPVRADYVCDRYQGRIDKQEPTTDDRYASHWDAEDMQRIGAMTAALEPTQKDGSGVLYLISHAKTRYNRPGQPHDIVQGWRDIPLDQQGRDQARKLGAFLKKQGVETIYASNLRRALQTATIAGRAAGINVVPDGAFRPWNLGDFAGHSSADVLPQLKPYMQNPDRKVDGGESFNEYEQRFLPALEKVLTLAEHGHRVALVTHSRNVETVEGWLGGHGYRKKVDTRAIERDQIQPATVIEISDQGGKLRSGEFIQIGKGQAHPAELRLRVHGVSTTPAGMRVYRMATREGHYVGRTLPTRIRARKGDVLKIQTTDFLADVQGDMHWTNPAVESHYSDAPHSWRELQALAGGALVKDGADGAAGDIPAAGDMGASDVLPSGNTAALAVGPTSGSVHVNVPLKDISVGYANRKLIEQALRKDGSYDLATLDRLEAVVKGAQPMKQLVYGVVLEPNTLDSQDDFMLPHHVEKAAHAYLARVIRGKASVAKLQHRAQGFKKTVPSLVPVESYIAPVDFALSPHEQVRAGSWVMVMKVEDDALWRDFLDGKYTGFSIGGTGMRRAMKAGDYSLAVPHGYIQREPADWPIAPHPDTVGALLI